MYGMRALGHREVETSSPSWLAEGHRLGPHSSLRLHPDVLDLFSPLRRLPSRDSVYVSILTAPVRIINPIASWLVRLSACGLSAVVGGVGVDQAGAHILWTAAFAAGYLRESCWRSYCRLDPWWTRHDHAVADVDPPPPPPPPPDVAPAPLPAPPVVLNVRGVPYFQSVRGRALVHRATQQRRPLELPRVPHAEYVAAMQRHQTGRSIPSDEVILSHAASRGVEPPPTSQVRFADTVRFDGKHNRVHPRHKRKQPSWLSTSPAPTGLDGCARRALPCGASCSRSTAGAPFTCITTVTIW